MVFWQRDWWCKWWQKRQQDCCDCECSWTKVVVCLTVMAMTGSVLILTFAVVRPPTDSANDALLTRFKLAQFPNSTARPPLQLLSYNATMTMCLRNANLHYGIIYGALVVAFSFNDTRFDESGTMPAHDLAVWKETVKSSMKRRAPTSTTL